MRSGPDIVIHWPAGDIHVYYDFTVIHKMSSSNLGKTGMRLMKDAISRKTKAYVNTGLISQEQFVCIPAFGWSPPQQHEAPPQVSCRCMQIETRGSCPGFRPTATGVERRGNVLPAAEVSRRTSG